MINLNEIEAITMTVQEYALILGKKTAGIRKNLRIGNALPYVISAVKHERYNYWILTCSSSIKMKQPLK